MEYQLKLKELRKAAGFATQKAFADFLGIKERKYAMRSIEMYAE